MQIAAQRCNRHTRAPPISCKNPALATSGIIRAERKRKRNAHTHTCTRIRTPMYRHMFAHICMHALLLHFTPLGMIIAWTHNYHATVWHMESCWELLMDHESSWATRAPEVSWERMRSSCELPTAPESIWELLGAAENSKEFTRALESSWELLWAHESSSANESSWATRALESFGERMRRHGSSRKPRRAPDSCLDLYDGMKCYEMQPNMWNALKYSDLHWNEMHLECAKSRRVSPPTYSAAHSSHSFLSLWHLAFLRIPIHWLKSPGALCWHISHTSHKLVIWSKSHQGFWLLYWTCVWSFRCLKELRGLQFQVIHKQANRLPIMYQPNLDALNLPSALNDYYF